MPSKIPMMFSQNMGYTGKISRRPITMPSVVSGPLFISSPSRSPVQQQQRSVVAASVASTSRSAPAPRNVKQLFNMGNIMSNPGTPCKACGS